MFHYEGKIQPIEFILEDNLDFCQGNIVKYIYRHKRKDGVKDLLKVIHYTLIEAKHCYSVEDNDWLQDEVKRLLDGNL